MMNKKDPSDLKLDFVKIIELFEKNISVEPLVSITACGVLSDLLSNDNQTSNFIYQKMSQVT